MSNLFSFLIATDCHLGYEETDPVIGEDSFITFEEILIKAVEQDVDLILLGGDLFHHNNPSQRCMNKCMELFRRYTLGNRPVYFELLCNATEVFSNSISQTTNYLDENINVSIPVFSIHGNHDDPSGIGGASALDTLSSAGLVNYFGKWTNLEEVIIKPILLRKGNTRIALYGLSHIKDDRLCRLFIDKKVKFLRPENDPNGWFNIFVLHQNRVDRGPKRFVSESHIPEFMDLVIWGHEHDCEIEPIRNLEKGFYVIQPGSSVATSLSEGEAIEKHVAVLKVFEKKMKIKPLKLNTTRPFIWRSVNLWDVMTTSEDREKKSEEIRTHCLQLVEEMIRQAKERVTGHTKQPKLPLVRLRCEYDDESQLFNVVKFGQVFQGRVANPNAEIIRLKRCFTKRGVKKENSEDLARLNELYKEDMEEVGNFTACVNHIVKDYFTNHEEAKMLILRVEEMGLAVEKFIDKDDIFAIEDLVEKRFKKMMKELTDQKINADETNLTELFQRLREEEEKLDVKEEEDLERELGKINAKGRKGSDSGSCLDKYSTANADMEEDSRSDTSGQAKDKSTVISDSDTDEYDVNEEFESGKKRNKRKDDFSDDDDMFGDRRSTRKDEEKSKPRGRGAGRGTGRGRGRGSRGGSKTAKPLSPRKSEFTPRGGKTRQPLKCGTSIVFEDDSD